ncbi:hypothetical protein EVAR_53346_1 [Eumeta japonica]|uniref:Uncharacterized protein n=1 Tax=Eumeta variegata TaxID=151549 RepID=A0A4C1YDH9_EUMVA|nr:hypothetical protein EVAR_53346_1 [Eumeta japonica]
MEECSELYNYIPAAEFRYHFAHFYQLHVWRFTTVRFMRIFYQVEYTLQYNAQNCRFELFANDPMRRYNTPRHYLLLHRDLILRHRDAFLTKFTGGQSFMRCVDYPLSHRALAPTSASGPVPNVDTGLTVASGPVAAHNSVLCAALGSGLESNSFIGTHYRAKNVAYT